MAVVAVTLRVARCHVRWRQTRGTRVAEREWPCWRDPGLFRQYAASEVCVDGGQPSGGLDSGGHG